MTDSFKVISALAPDTDLVFQFFAFFSRFEYSLKRSGFLKSGKLARPNWDKYADSLRGRFAEIDKEEFNSAIGFLKRDPPKTQIVTGDELNWQETLQGSGEHHEQYILRLVRTVRNNLFHGGKYPLPLGPVADIARNCQLLQACIAVLSECLKLNERVRTMFEDTG